MAVRDNLWDRDVFWVNPVGTTASDEQGACNLMETVGDLTSVEDIWSGLASFETDHGARAGVAAVGRDYCPKTNVCWRYSSQNRHLLEKFGQVLCWFGIFGLGFTLVEYFYAPSRSWEWT